MCKRLITEEVVVRERVVCKNKNGMDSGGTVDRSRFNTLPSRPPPPAEEMKSDQNEQEKSK